LAKAARALSGISAVKVCPLLLAGIVFRIETDEKIFTHISRRSAEIVQHVGFAEPDRAGIKITFRGCWV
jgi:hypothetical protein